MLRRNQPPRLAVSCGAIKGLRSGQRIIGWGGPLIGVQPTASSVDMTSNDKSGLQRFEVGMMFLLLRAWEEAEPVGSDGGSC
jgi:hypothetical protein